MCRPRYAYVIFREKCGMNYLIFIVAFIYFSIYTEPIKL